MAYSFNGEMDPARHYNRWEIKFENPEPYPLVTVNGDGNIIGLNLVSQGLQDEDIADLSHLPSKLEVLNLRRNQLSVLDLSMLPRTLKYLYLGSNKLRSVDFGNLPMNLTLLDLQHNELRHVELSDLREGLDELDLSNNRLRQVNLINLAVSLQTVDLRGKEVSQVTLWMDNTLGARPFIENYGDPYGGTQRYKETTMGYEFQRGSHVTKIKLQSR